MNLNTAFNSLLDAASAGVSSVSPTAGSMAVHATDDHSKSQSFVAFDDVVLAAGGDVSRDASVTAGLVLKDEVKDEMKDELEEEEEAVVELWASRESVVDMPNVLFVGSDIEDRCRVSPPGLNKWCYSCNCNIKSHEGMDQVEVKPGLYIKNKGRGVNTLAFATPHVPLSHVWGKGYVQGLLSSTKRRSIDEWEHIFQVINVRKGNFKSFEELEVQVSDLQNESDNFKTPMKSKVEDFRVKGETNLLKEENGLLDGLKRFKTVLDVSTESESDPVSTERVLSELEKVLSKILSHAASASSVQELGKEIDMLQKQQKSTMAKLIEVLAGLGDRSRTQRRDDTAQQNVFAELSRLSAEMDGFSS